MNIAIYCGSSLGNNKIYEEQTKVLAQKLAEKNLNIVYGGSLQEVPYSLLTLKSWIAWWVNAKAVLQG